VRRSVDPILLRGRRPGTPLGILAAILSVLAVTALLYPLKQIAPVVSLGVVYLVPVLVISTYWGLWLGAATALASALAFNSFHLPPVGRLTLADSRNWVALLAFLVVALVVSSVAEAARSRAAEAQERQREADQRLEEYLAAEAEGTELRRELVEAQAVRRSDELKTALLRSVSHDLRTPLTAILTAATALRSRGLDAREREEVQEGIVADATRLSRLIDKLLDLSRLQAGSAEPQPTWCAIDEVLREAVEHVAADRAAFSFALDAGLPLVRADATQLERAFANLLENAVRYGAGKPVSLRARVVGSRLIVRVVDQGPGIPSKEHERIFSPFYRAPAAVADGGPHGSGLGLAIARGFVEANGGRLTVESLPGQGTSFVVAFGAERLAAPASFQDAPAGVRR